MLERLAELFDEDRGSQTRVPSAAPRDDQASVGALPYSPSTDEFLICS